MNEQTQRNKKKKKRRKNTLVPEAMTRHLASYVDSKFNELRRLLSMIPKPVRESLHFQKWKLFQCRCFLHLPQCFPTQDEMMGFRCRSAHRGDQKPCSISHVLEVRHIVYVCWWVDGDPLLDCIGLSYMSPLLENTTVSDMYYRYLFLFRFVVVLAKFRSTVGTVA